MWKKIKIGLYHYKGNSLMSYLNPKEWEATHQIPNKSEMFGKAQNRIFNDMSFKMKKLKDMQINQ